MQSFSAFASVAREWIPTTAVGLLCQYSSDRQNPNQFTSESVSMEMSEGQPSSTHPSLEEKSLEIPDETDSFVSASSFSDQELDTATQELRRVFDQFDENKDGKISREEMSRSLERFGIVVDERELITMIDGADTNSDGFVDFSEFLTFYYTLSEEKTEEGDHTPGKEEAELKEAFQVFDKDGDGFICAEELQSVLSSMGLEQGRKLIDCRNMIRKVDADGDGQVNFEEFKRMMTVGFGD